MLPIVMVRNTPINKYGKYFLASEAPDDEGDGTQSNVEVVSVPQNTDKRKKDFTAGSDDEIVQDNEGNDDTDFTAGSDDAGAGADDTDFTDGSNDAGADATDTGGGDEVQVDDTGGDDTDFTDGSNDAGADATDTGGGDGGGDAGGDDTDFTAGSDDAGGGADATDTGGNTGGGDGNNNGAGTDQDSTRKYKLYLEYMSLHTSLENYISKLEKIIKDDPDSNRIVIYCTRRFKDIKTLLYDYILIKYVQNNYIQNLLFYEKLIAATQLTLKMLKQINDINKSNN